MFAQKQERRSDVFPQKHWMHFPGKLFQKGWLQLTVFVLPVRQREFLVVGTQKYTPP